MTDSEKAQTASSEGGKSAASAAKFTVERLIEDSEHFLGVRRHVAAGGLHGVKGEITVEQAKARIDKWLTTPAKGA